MHDLQRTEPLEQAGHKRFIFFTVVIVVIIVVAVVVAVVVAFDMSRFHDDLRLQSSPAGIKNNQEHTCQDHSFTRGSPPAVPSTPTAAGGRADVLVQHAPQTAHAAAGGRAAGLEVG
jgi:hypothetical protein